MTVMLVWLNPEHSLPCMLDLRLIANPAGSRQKDITLQDVKQGKEKGF
jgi:hypothetical protein